jgi:hypothetical protein
MTNEINIRSEHNPTQDRGASFGHCAPGDFSRFGQLNEGRLDQDGVMNGSADANAGLCSQAACETQHLSSIGLHGKIPKRAGVGPQADVNRPSEHGPKLAV